MTHNTTSPLLWGGSNCCQTVQAGSGLGHILNELDKLSTDSRRSVSLRGRIWVTRWVISTFSFILYLFGLNHVAPISSDSSVCGLYFIRPRYRLSHHCSSVVTISHVHRVSRGQWGKGSCSVMSVRVLSLSLLLLLVSLCNLCIVWNHWLPQSLVIGTVVRSFLLIKSSDGV